MSLDIKSVIESEKAFLTHYSNRLEEIKIKLAKAKFKLYVLEVIKNKPAHPLHLELSMSHSDLWDSFIKKIKERKANKSARALSYDVKLGRTLILKLESEAGYVPTTDSALQTLAEYFCK